MKNKVQFIVIGGSAGSLQVLLKILELIHPDFSIPVLLVLHRNKDYPSTLTELLLFKTKLAVKEVEEKDAIKPGHLYICPPDFHVLIEKDKSFSLDYSEKINFSRPSIDIIFKSAAIIYKDHLLCILLSGANADGAEGMVHAKKNGSLIAVQDPQDAQVPYMPQEAIYRVKADYILSGEQIAGLLNSLIG